MKQPLSLLDMLALRTLTVGVAFLGADSTGKTQLAADREGVHSSQFQYFIEDTQVSSPLKLASDIYRLTGRTSFAAPGFALLRQTKVTSSKAHKQTLIDLKENLSQVHQAVAGQSLGWFSISRADQKTTTKPHRDPGPAQSLLLLGYEPSTVKSDLWIADYSACAHLLGLSPVQFLEEFNPMYKKGMHHLAPYVMPILEFDPSCYNILVINNSSTPLNRQEHNWQGILHCSQIYGKSTAPRVINSTSIMPLAAGEKDAIGAEALEKFVSSDKLNETSYAT